MRCRWGALLADSDSDADLYLMTVTFREFRVVVGLEWNEGYCNLCAVLSAILLVSFAMRLLHNRQLQRRDAAADAAAGHEHME